MALRLSFTLDPELSERIDLFAKKQDLDRNEAVLRLIESGLFVAEQKGEMPPAPKRDFKEMVRMQRNAALLLRSMDELKKEVRVMHHMINLEEKREAEEKAAVKPVTKWLDRLDFTK
ncbi:MAG TPA: type II secretion system protein E [Methanocorpusculum sp.]|nr:type II secretion system protein E [Methanocorpusculum sp.]